MNIESIRKRVALRKANEQMKTEIRNKIKSRKDELQDIRIERKDVFEPVTLTQKEVKEAITKTQREVKETIDNKQDAMIAQLQENQAELAQSIGALTNVMSQQGSLYGTKSGIEKWIPDPYSYEPIEEEVIDDDGTVVEADEDDAKEKDDTFSVAEKAVIAKYKFDPSLEKIPNMEVVRNVISYLNGKRNVKNESIRAKAKWEQDVIKKYYAHLKGYEKGEKKGKGIRTYKQPKRNAYKINGNQYGGLLINVPRLMNEMIIEAHKGGQIVYQDEVDKSTIDLLTKRFDPKKRYPSVARQIFNNLNLLSGIPKHKSSGKYGLTGGAVYYSKPEDLMKRLTVVTGSRRSGNTSIPLRNEAWEIIDVLLREGAITREQHDAYVKRHLA